MKITPGVPGVYELWISPQESLGCMMIGIRTYEYKLIRRNTYPSIRRNTYEYLGILRNTYVWIRTNTYAWIQCPLGPGKPQESIQINLRNIIQKTASNTTHRCVDSRFECILSSLPPSLPPSLLLPPIPLSSSSWVPLGSPWDPMGILWVASPEDPHGIPWGSYKSLKFIENHWNWIRNQWKWLKSITSHWKSLTFKLNRKII